MKKLISFLIILAMLFVNPVVYAYTVEDAYDELAAQYPQFVSEIEGKGINKEMTVDFMEDVREYMAYINKTDPITEENFESSALSAINIVSSREKYLKFQDALIELYPEAIKQAVFYGKIAPEFRPIINTIKKIVFSNGMLDIILKPDGPVYIVAYKSLTETVLAGSGYKLPETIDMVDEYGDIVKAQVVWNGSVNASKIGTYSVHGVVSLPDGYLFENGISNGFDYTVIAVDKLEGRFTDVSEAYWGYEAICALSDRMIINGYLDNTFKPDNNITRAEFAKIIVSVTGSYNGNAESSFIDVNKADWYYAYVSSAMERGYITGYPDGSFRPNDNITRADLCTVVYRCIKDRIGEASSPAVFTDSYEIPSYASDGIYALTAAGLINGMGDGCFAPKACATRAQTAKIIFTAFIK